MLSPAFEADGYSIIHKRYYLLPLSLLLKRNPNYFILVPDYLNTRSQAPARSYA